MIDSRQAGRSSSNLVALLGIGVLLLFALGMHSCLFGGLGFDFLGNRNFNNGWSLLGVGLGVGGLLQVGLALWVGYDAHRRGLNGFLWGLLVLFTFIVGLVVYLIVGPSMGPHGGTLRGERAAGTPAPQAGPPARAAGTATGAPRSGTPDIGPACPHCDAPVQADFNICPYCAGPLRCAECQGALARGYKVCPRCGTSVPGQARLS